MSKLISIIIVSVSLTFADTLSLDSEYKNFTIPQRLSAAGLNYVLLIVAFAIEEDVDFSKAGGPSFLTGENIGIGLTLFSGLGSWVIMDDILGAVAQGALSGIGFALIVKNKYSDDDCEGEHCVGSDSGSITDAAFAGLCMLMGGQGIGLLRPLFYNKPKPKSASASKAGDFSMAVLPSRQGDLKAYLMYSKGL